MYEIRTNKTFKTAYKKILRSGKFRHDKFTEIVESLRQGLEVPSQYHDHALTGNMAGKRECHISGDMLLVYELDLEIKMILLTNIGNHAQVFES